MKISWYGQSFFRILTKKRGRDLVKIAIDPFEDNIGLKTPSLEADILLITHQHPDHFNLKAIKGSPFLISGPGEYEVKNVFIQGISAFHDKNEGKKRGKVTIYTIKSEGMTICHLGDLGQTELTPDQLDEIGDVDILMIPVGGVYTISAKEAIKIISQLEPKIVIPMHYKIPKLKIKLEELNKFLKVMGIKRPEKSEKLSINKKDLPSDGTKVVVLEI
jgi:L-ascorbate metabolism protein UlaG (beta-lactamase superfamily)